MRKDRKPSYNESISSDESASINSDDEAQRTNMNGFDDDSELSDEQNDIQHLINRND